MLIKSIKLITSILLTMVLVFLVTKRDLILPSKKLLKAPPTSIELSSSSSEVTPDISSTTPTSTSSLVEDSHATDTPIDTKETPLPSPPPTPTVVRAPIKIVEPQKPSVYKHLNEGTSDTDVTYHPTVSPCTTPMGYKIGTFDSRFGISREMFLQNIKQAADLWGDVLGKDLFYYSGNGSLTINLIYDERQATTQDVNYLALEIENSKSAADAIRQSYEQEKVIYLADGAQLTRDGEAFQQKNKHYADKVAMYNQSGGATKTDYDAMTAELVALKQEAAELDARRAVLNATMEKVNAEVTKYNELVAYINTLIEKSNALGAKKFTEGKFTSGINRIDIYQYNDGTKLRRVIAHELGHALGISKHATTIGSIMYSVNSATTTTLSSEDISALMAVCSSY